MKPRINIDSDYNSARAVAWTFWLLAILGSVLNTMHLIPRQAGLLIIVCLGVGIYSSMVLSRFKQSATMRDVFLTGLHAATSLSGRTEAKLRELHYPTSLREDLPADVCHECAQRYPCVTVRILDGEEIHIVTEQALQQPREAGSI